MKVEISDCTVATIQNILNLLANMQNNCSVIITNQPNQNQPNQPNQNQPNQNQPNQNQPNQNQPNQNQLRKCSRFLVQRIYNGAQLSEETLTCSICMDTIRNAQEMEVLPCGHHFHSRCMIAQIQNCPMCRSN